MFSKFEMTLANVLLWTLCLSLWGGLLCLAFGGPTEWAGIGVGVATAGYIPFLIKIIRIARLFARMT